jgi:hypothetical protein
VVTLLPRDLLGRVLQPLTSALAARSRFSLERFSDVFLLTRAVAEHVGACASSGRVSFALSAADQQLELAIGPLRAGAGRELHREAARLADELVAEPLESAELMRVVVSDADRIPRPVHG